jgi:DNA adenine methylase
MSIKHPVMRYHGGKFRLAPWVIRFFPEHYTYVEPFGGAAGVLIQKEPSKSEVYNDLDGDIVNVFRVLQCPDLSDALMNKLSITPFARSEFDIAFETCSDPVEMARRTLIRSAMGFGSGGATKNRTGFRVDSYRSYSTGAQTWSKYPPLIAKFCQRLQGVIIENRAASTVIENHDRPDTLFFVDPPYVLDTRHAGSKTKVYRHEMSDEQHFELIQQLINVDGLVVLSGYDSEAYNDTLVGWVKYEKSARIASNRGTGTRIERVWLNPACAATQPQQQLFG